VPGWRPKTQRQTQSDKQGQFVFGPVAAGKYSLSVEDSRFMPLPLDVSLESNPPLALRPSELVTVRLKFVNSKGEPLTRREAHFLGTKNKQGYHTDAWTNGQGVMEFRVPKLDWAGVDLGRSPGTVPRWRRGENEALNSGYRVTLGPLYTDMSDVTVIESKPPQLSVRVVDQ